MATLRSSVRQIAIASRSAPTAYRCYASSSRPAAGSSSEASSSKIVPTPSQSEPLPEPSSSSRPQTASAASSSTNKNEPLELPMLPRPLGTPLPPSSSAKTWSDKKEDYMNEDRHKAKRKALFQEASQGYFHDYNKARKAFGGKLWTAPNTLIREDRALYFPDLSGRSLAGNNRHTTDILKGKISLVTLLNTRLSEEHAQSFTQNVVEDWGDNEHFNLVQINHQRNPLKSMLLNLFVSSLKRTIPEKRWDTYLISGGEWSEYDINHPLGIENKILGYVYLVDPNAKIRWAGNAMASEQEAQNLRRAAAVLMTRMQGKAEGESGQQA